MKGFGIDIKDPNHYGDERRHAHRRPSVGQAAPRKAAAPAWRTCSRRIPDINVVYTINEPTAAGAYEALKAAGKDDGSVLVVSVDGGCPGVKNVEAGVIGATSQQYPLLMASMGVRGGRRVRQVRQEARADPRPELLQHRRQPDHRQAGRRRPVDHDQRGPGASAGADVPGRLQAVLDCNDERSSRNGRSSICGAPAWLGRRDERQRQTAQRRHGRITSSIAAGRRRQRRHLRGRERIAAQAHPALPARQSDGDSVHRSGRSARALLQPAGRHRASSRRSTCR